MNRYGGYKDHKKLAKIFNSVCFPPIGKSLNKIIKDYSKTINLSSKLSEIINLLSK